MSYYPPAQPDPNQPFVPPNPYQAPPPYASPASQPVSPQPPSPYLYSAGVSSPAGLYQTPASLPLASGAFPPMTGRQLGRGIILKASLIAGAIEAGYVISFVILSEPNAPLANMPLYAYPALDFLFGMLVAFVTGLLVVRRTGRIAPGLIATLWATLCYAVARFGIISVPSVSAPFHNMTGLLLSTAMRLLAFIPISLFGAWMGGLIGRRGGQTTDGVYGAYGFPMAQGMAYPGAVGMPQIGQAPSHPALGMLVRVFPAANVRKAVGGGLGVIVGSIVIFALLRFGLGIGGTAIFGLMAASVIGSIGYMVRAANSQGKNIALYTNGLIVQTPQGPLPVRWNEIAQVTPKDELFTITGACITLPSTTEGITDLRAAIQMGVVQARAQ